METIAFFNKWLHLLSVIGTLGGIAFAWLTLVPALRGSDEAASDTARNLWRRFGISLGVLWLLVLFTGFFNYYIVAPSVIGRYHMFAGMKMGFAILMFLLSMALTHPAPMLANLRRNRGPLLLALIALGVVVVGISAKLNMGRMDGSLKQSAPILAPGAPAP